MFRKTLALSFVLVLSHSALAQEALQRRPAPDFVKPTPCPHPYSQTLTGGAGASTPVLSPDFPASVHAATAGSVWNQPGVDKTFAHTFRFPATEGCCVVTKATLTVTIKALNSGGVGGHAANNDAVHVYHNGAAILSQQPWVTTGVTAGTVATLTFNIPANALATGMVSFLVQDDSTVQSAQLVLEGCCLKKQK